MAFLVGGANSASSAYEIENSCRFNRGDSPALSYSFSSTDSSWTVSCWIKRAELSTNTMYPFGFGTAGTDAAGVSFSGSDSMAYYDEDGSTLVRDTTILFRDPSAWYHVVCKNDGGTITTYMNGVQQATGSGGTSLDGSTFYIGRFAGSTTYHFDGYISEFYFIDGTAYSPSTFAETNDNGVWVPIEASPTFGSDGFFCEFKETGTSANSSGIGADTSGNDNHLTVSNLAATDITTDTPTNNFCTMNPLNSYSGITFSEGNLQTNLGGSNHRWGTSTFFVANGKWYFECKLLSDSNYNSGPGVIAYGIDDPLHTEGGGAGSKAEGWIYLSTNAGDLQHGGTQYGTANAATTNDILMVAFDADAGKIWIGKGGSWNDGDPAAGSGAVREDLGDASSGLFSPGVSGYAENLSFNFGNPAYANSSSVADANGYGAFEYEPPSGFYALCTKNLAEFG